MKLILHLLLVLALAFSNYATAAPSCCDEPDQQCDIVQCTQMGCMPAATPIPMASPALVMWERAGRDYAPEPVYHLPALNEAPWTPPD